ncbi:MAG: glucuronate isomerase [Firmicutes bacterium]|nr:glucuronate isomerase [Bacillota bacterium]
MKSFFHDNILLEGDSALALYDRVKGLPIIDYHCHLNQADIAADKQFADIGELWLGSDHYKWRAMRLCGVEERYITGKTSFESAGEKRGKARPTTWKERFLKYAEIMPKLFGNPLYYFSHLELKQVFGITKPLSADTAEEIYAEANEKLKTLSVRKLLEKFNVEYIATTDDPIDDLADHGQYGKTTVVPTFRPDEVFSFIPEYIENLGRAAGIKIKTYGDLQDALEKRLDYFISKGCRISDHAFADFPKECSAYCSNTSAAENFERLVKRNSMLHLNSCDIPKLSEDEEEGLRYNLMAKLRQMYQKRGIAIQYHFSVRRNVNIWMWEEIGSNSGFDVMSPECSYANLFSFLPSSGSPSPIILYSLNPGAIAPLANISGAFRNVYIGAAWWFNDSLEGIRKHLSTVAEYAALGTNLGMLTDSRSFLSYSRFDFFRRILCTFVGQKVDAGEYSASDAFKLCEDICYNNIKKLLRI